MSKHEVVDSYLRGNIDRREFVRRLTSIGVSAVAAAAYAQTLSQSASASGTGRTGGFVNAFAAQDDYVADADGDGFTDAEEEDCGSDPDDPDSTCDSEKPKPSTKPSQLPSTGAGTMRSEESGRWLAPLAAAGAGAAFLARRIKGASKTQ